MNVYGGELIECWHGRWSVRQQLRTESPSRNVRTVSVGFLFPFSVKRLDIWYDQVVVVLISLVFFWSSSSLCCGSVGISIGVLHWARPGRAPDCTPTCKWGRMQMRCPCLSVCVAGWLCVSTVAAVCARNHRRWTFVHGNSMQLRAGAAAAIWLRTKWGRHWICSRGPWPRKATKNKKPLRLDANR